jgi:protein involved in polysaccharide export with SLBB domain
MHDRSQQRASAVRRKMDWRRWSLLLALVATGCRSFDESRVVQTLNQRGFGRKYIGDSNEVLTIGIGDSFKISDARNEEITGNFTVRMDGVIEDPLVGEVFVAGFSTAEIAETLNQRYLEFYKDPKVRVEVANIQSKYVFLQGELGGGREPFKGNLTVWDLVMSKPIVATADLSDIYVMRPDPVHPLVIPVDLKKMLYDADSRDNILLREDDIVYVNANFAGIIKNAVNLLLEPIQPVLQFAVSIRNIETIYDSFKDDENFYVGGGYGGSSNFGGSGYGSQFSQTSGGGKKGGGNGGGGNGGGNGGGGGGKP